MHRRLRQTALSRKQPGSHDEDTIARELQVRARLYARAM
jgi:hypothetical protein